MKPCSLNRKPLTLFAINALDFPQAQKLQAHLEICPGCRAYLAEISRMTANLAAADTTPDVTVSDSFHRSLVSRLRQEQPVSAWVHWGSHFGAGFLSWRVALPATAAILVLLGGLSFQRQPSRVRPVSPLPVEVREPTTPDSNLSPTLANYQMVADESLEKLDALLTRQGKTMPSTPIYTASTLSLANTSF